MHLVKLHSPTGPIWIFLTVAAVVAVGPWLVERVRLPGLIGLIIGGYLIGPHALRVVDASDTFVSGLGQVGLLYLMFLAGLDLDFEVFRQHRNAALGFAALTFGLPMLFGYLSGVALGYETAAAILIGSLLASHTLLSYPAVRRAGLATNRAVAAAVGATVICDTASLAVLAAVAGSASGDGSGLELASQIVLGFAILGLFCGVVLPRLTKLLFTHLGQDPSVRFVLVLVSLLGASVVAETVGIEPIIGAFFAGLALNRIVPRGGQLFERIEFFGGALFIPLFLVSVGLIVDPKVMADAHTLGIAAVLCGAVIAAKALAATICRWLFHYSWPEVGITLSLSVAQAAATLAATIVGYQVGLLGTSVVNAVLVVIVVTVVLSSVLASVMAPRIPIPPPDTSRLARHVVVSVSDAAGVAAVALAVRLAAVDGGVVQPLYALSADTPVPGTASIDALQRTLTASGIDRAVEVHVGHTVPEAIVHAAAGARASLVVTGAWPLPDDHRSPVAPGRGDPDARLATLSTRPVLFVVGDAAPARVVAVVPDEGPTATLVREVAVRLGRSGLPVLDLIDEPVEEAARDQRDGDLFVVAAQPDGSLGPVAARLAMLGEVTVVVVAPGRPEPSVTAAILQGGRRATGPALPAR